MQSPITKIEPRIANRLAKQRYHLVGSLMKLVVEAQLYMPLALKSWE